MSRKILPALITVQGATYEVGRIATLELLASIRNPESGRMVRVPYALKLRQSTGRVQE